MNKTKLEKFTRHYRTLINQDLQQYLTSLTGNVNLVKAMSYSVMAGGKRIRPLLVLAVCHDLTGEITEGALTVAASLELLHTYSLIHDDLPEMDNDDLRRGRLTNHKVFGQAAAVLAGDALLTNAFAWLATADLPSDEVVKLIGCLGQAAGAEGMVSGQMSDILGENQKLKLAELQQLHRQKTGALLLYACQAGAILAGASSKIENLIIIYGQAFGLAFQIYDDILDETSTTVEQGKRVHKDQTEHKNTYPGLLGISGAQEALAQALEQAAEALEKLRSLGYECPLLKDMLGYFAGEKK
ncbi:MAG: polyprenyl synthetase family protein [Liquorilactobacillus nagelii]|jgi:geranylgeranyl diphosphate synthase type II|uniref:polyprenyl synthetase family protein n=1 Tax=Liquorilactobacillus nagelii TaxID=82688 RepID=UPI001CCECA6B|nr:farnesyl diphosphate synthase [Liquorilactobacillus nagelii]MCI1920518.1 polyprenyl synthetase family protein [Liquorilactobacillus nagelii]MCI1976161.1 polyprenyl synthetase family protein [Liquorilactobacillus nagelii]ULQ50350.1 polyprenyl synthetase family protein [Liquorilactobacillus nagelii]